jgi:DNA invertase Pin-like site-specific DNA recombinase
MPKPKETIYAATYCRYSSHGQTEQSIEGQLRDNYEFARREGYTIVAEYIDRARTGRSDNRDEFQRMISDAAKRGFSVVIVWKLDRFARNRYDSAIYKAKLKRHGVRVVSAKESITDTPEGIILEGMLESMAEYYSANLSVNVKRGQRETIAKGRFCGGSIPYGYKVVEGKLVPDEKTAPVIKYVYEEYARGVPKKQIIEALTRRGVKSPTGKLLGLSTFQRALRNTVYYGDFVVNGKVVEGCATPIISKELFDEVQAKLNTVAHAPAAAKAQVDYLLRGKAFCGYCGAPIVGESGRGKSGSMFHYYACANRKKLHTCKKRNERKDDVESYAVVKTVNYILNPDHLRDTCKAVVAEYNKVFSSSKVTDLERELNRLERELNNLVDTLAEAPKVTHKRIYEKMEALENQKADLEEDLAKMRIAIGIRYKESDVSAWLKQFCDGDVNDESYRRRIIDTLVGRVYLFDNDIVIFYNIHGKEANVPFSALQQALATPAPTPSGCSDLKRSVPPHHFKSEHRFIFVNGVFGCIFSKM